MIQPRIPQTTAAVAAHYDELDVFYREIWGDHLHHGYWTTGRETPAEAAEALVDLLADRLDLRPGLAVVDIGCGYGETARRLAASRGVDVTGLTVSAAQAGYAASKPAAGGRVKVLVRDWLANGLPDDGFDRAYAIESSEHMPDKQRFFNEAFRVLRPGGIFGVYVWLSRSAPRGWEVRHLLEPICREGRLPGMGDEADYRAMAEAAGFRVELVSDISDRVRRTWSVCLRRVAGKVATETRYRRFLMERSAKNRVFALTLGRLLLAYRTRSMRYCLLVMRK
ncbi:class I SAM-dependent methyltransferase [Acidisoma sp.]|uniref:class I SAM-dependent methyltransferase n=1 Tax=Acidisoma sp. TaxID=1872115 RepID=UPI003AFFD373